MRFRVEYELEVADRRELVRILNGIDRLVVAAGATPGAAEARHVTPTAGGRRLAGMRGALGTILWRRA